MNSFCLSVTSSSELRTTRMSEPFRADNFANSPAKQLIPLICFIHVKPPVAQLLNGFPTFHGTRKFITVIIRAFHKSISWVEWIQSIRLNNTSLRPVLILSFNLVQIFLLVSFLTTFQPKHFANPFFYSCVLISRQSHFPHITCIIWRV
jgi:hypothetical protein